MNELSLLRKFEDEIEQFQPGLSVDCVIVGYNQNGLHVLVLKWKKSDFWTLPGGFVNKEEDLQEAALRILKQRTGLDYHLLRQFCTFGDLNRRDGQQLEDLISYLKGVSNILHKWFLQRFISVGYLALVDLNAFKPVPDIMSEICEWRNIDELPNLVFDHRQMIDKALSFIRLQLNYLPAGISLLPERFTMKELQNLYEAILGKSLDRGNFQKRMLKIGFLERHEKLMKGGAHKAPFLYSFNKEKYHKMLEQGIDFIS